MRSTRRPLSRRKAETPETARDDVTSETGVPQHLQPANFEVPDHRSTQRLTESRADLFVRGMPEVRLQSGEIVEVDDRDVVHAGHGLLVGDAVGDAAADAHAAYGRNL